MGTGGTRYGAGRPGYRVKAEDCRQLDVRRWQREGMLVPGQAGGWYWRDPDTGATRASIGWRVEAGVVVLVYAINGEPVTQRVPIERTSCNYGGSRAWFRCPRCARRVAVLFLRGRGFACRHCQQVAYRSQSEDDMGRAWIKQRKAEAKLGENWSRPKGMHHATRERLLSVIFDCEQARTDALAAFLDRQIGTGWRTR